LNLTRSLDWLEERLAVRKSTSSTHNLVFKARSNLPLMNSFLTTFISRATWVTLSIASPNILNWYLPRWDHVIINSCCTILVGICSAYEFLECLKL